MEIWVFFLNFFIYSYCGPVVVVVVVEEVVVLAVVVAMANDRGVCGWFFWVVGYIILL